MIHTVGFRWMTALAPVILATWALTLSLPAHGAPIVDFAGPLASSGDYKYDKNNLPISGTTDFNKGKWNAADPLNTAEHELLHVLGFTVQSKLFKDSLTAANEIKVGGTVYGITDGTSHLDPKKTVKIGATNFDQSKDIMRPDKVNGQRVGDQDKMILDALYNYSGIGGLSITVNFTGAAFTAADKQAINDAAGAMQKLFPAGKTPHKIAWDAQNVVCKDPQSDDGACQVSAVPAPGSLTLLVTALAMGAAGLRRAKASMRAT